MEKKKFEIYMESASYIQESESMIDAILEFARKYPCSISSILGVIEQCDESKWIYCSQHER